MENLKTNSFSRKIGILLDYEVEFSQKLKQHLVFKSDQVSNPFKFIGALLSKGVLSDGSDDSGANFGLKEMMVRLAMMMACTKDADSIGGLMEALDASGNPQLISDFQAWVKESYGVETEWNFGGFEADTAAASTPKSVVWAQPKKHAKERSSCGTKLIDKIVEHVEFDFMGKLQGHLVGKASEIANVAELCSSLVHQKVLDETDTQIVRATAPEVQEGQQIKKVIKTAFSKRAIGSLVVALQNSNNEDILLGICDWLDTSTAKQKNYPILLKSLARERGPTATKIFAATESGLISLDLKTLEATALTSECTHAVAVNHKLKKVYWTQGGGNSSIMRSNLDGSNREMIIPPAGDYIFMLAIEETSGNVYFAPSYCHKINVCSPLGQNCTVVISNPSLVNNLAGFALDSLKGFMYWGNRPDSSPHSLMRANLDGSNPTIISTGFKSLEGITLDQTSNDVLYWIDYGTQTIGTIDANGGNKRTLVELESHSGLWGITAGDNKIYISTCANKTILSFDRDSNKNLKTILNSTGKVYNLAIFNTIVKQS